MGLFRCEREQSGGGGVKFGVPFSSKSDDRLYSFGRTPSGQNQDYTLTEDAVLAFDMTISYTSATTSSQQYYVQIKLPGESDFQYLARLYFQSGVPQSKPVRLAIGAETRSDKTGVLLPSGTTVRLYIQTATYVSTDFYCRVIRPATS